MFRFILRGAACAALTLAPFARAQSTNEVWKDLIVQASYSAGENDYGKAEQIYQQALREAEHFGGDDPRLGSTLNSLGQIYVKEKKYADADAALRRAYSVLEKASGIKSMDVAEVNFNLGVLMFDQGHQPMALPYLNKTLATYEATLDADNEKIAAVLCMLGDAYRIEKDFQAAEDPLKRCADIRERDGGMQNADLAEAMHSLALVYQAEGKYAMADPRFKLAEKIMESTLGIMSPSLAQTMEDHVMLLRQLGREKEAARLELMASAIRRNRKNAGK